MVVNATGNVTFVFALLGADTRPYSIFKPFVLLMQIFLLVLAVVLF